MKQKLTETRKKEWKNWSKYSDGRWITEGELRRIQRKDDQSDSNAMG